jgi:large subunit ribosomal protein L34e
MAPRVTYRRHCSYNTLSNKIRKVRTPGGRLAALHVKKNVKAATCGEAGCNLRLGGLKRVRSSLLKNLKKRERTVSRAYGGNLCG